MASTSLKVILSAVDKLSPVLKKVTRFSKLTTRSLRNIARAGSQIAKSIGVGAVAAFGVLFLGLKRIVDVSAEFERFETILETVTGSAQKAKAAMGWVQEFAIKTPYELNEVTESFVRLKAYGIDPQNGALESAGNAAAAMGKTMLQAVEAMADAMTGENERLKEFGIVAKKQGDKITYNWVQNGKQMSKTANANSRDQIEAVLKGIWNGSYAGAMDKLAKTYEGLWSNIQDTWAKFLLKIGDRGLFDALKAQLQGVLDLFDAWDADGTLDKIATQISSGLTDMVLGISSALRNIDWVETIKSVKSTARSIVSLVDALGGIKGILTAIGVALLAGPVAAILSIGGTLFTFASGALAILGGPLLAGILAVVAGVFLIYKNWDKVSQAMAPAISALSGVFSELWSQLKSLYKMLAPVLIPVLKVLGTVLLAGVVGALFAMSKALQFVVYIITLAVTHLNNMLKVAKIVGSAIKKVFSIVAPDWLKDLFGSSSEVKVSANGAASGARNKILSAGQQKLNGDISVKFENAPAGMRVAEAKTNQSGVKMNADVGYRNLGVAYAL